MLLIVLSSARSVLEGLTYIAVSLFASIMGMVLVGIVVTSGLVVADIGVLSLAVQDGKSRSVCRGLTNVPDFSRWPSSESHIIFM